MHFYKKNIGDYHKKAGRLTMLQHGSYTLLMDACYDREQFPTLEEAINWTWASTHEEIEAVTFVLSRFFTLIDGFYVQARIAQEITKYQENAKINKRIAVERERQKKTNREEKSTNREQTVNETPDKQERTVNEAPPNHKPLTINHKPLTNDKTHTSPAAPWQKKYSDEDYQLAEFIYQRVLIIAPHTKKPNLEKWADVIRLMVSQDKLNHQLIVDVFAWANGDDFWKTNILSPKKLRIQFSRLHAKKENPNENSKSDSLAEYAKQFYDPDAAKF